MKDLKELNERWRSNHIVRGMAVDKKVRDVISRMDNMCTKSISVDMGDEKLD